MKFGEEFVDKERRKGKKERKKRQNFMSRSTDEINKPVINVIRRSFEDHSNSNLRRHA